MHIYTGIGKVSFHKMMCRPHGVTLDKELFHIGD